MEQNSMQCITGLCGAAVGYSYVPIQMLNDLYTPEEALCRGTVFPELDLPLGVYGVFPARATQGGAK